VQGAIDQLVNDLIKQQRENGSWNFCFESGTMTDAYMILLMRILGIRDQKLQDSLVERILNKQTRKGIWKLYADEKGGNLSATIESSMALLYAGVKQPEDPSMVKANQFIRAKGGIEQASSLTKALLAVLGHLKWSKRLRIPISFLLLPPHAPINFFDLVGYARVHMAPILLTVDQNYRIRLPGKRKVSNWLHTTQRSGYPLQMHRHLEYREAFLQDLQRHLPWPTPPLHQQAVEWGKEFLLQRIESDGTLYSYFSSTFFLIIAFLARGYSSNHPVVQKAVQGLYGLVYPLKEGLHVQETTSTVWDTSLILYALQEAGVSHQHPIVQRGLDYILKKQHAKVGDWIIRNPKALPGGWGFSDSNSINPDVDDTTACLRALDASRSRHRREWKERLIGFYRCRIVTEAGRRLRRILINVGLVS
jgi:sporulenol synthase